MPSLPPPIPPPRFAVQIIFHKDNPGIDYEFYVPAERKEEERERPKDRERETPRSPPRDTSREREPARAPLRSKYPPPRGTVPVLALSCVQQRPWSRWREVPWTERRFRRRQRWLRSSRS